MKLKNLKNTWTRLAGPVLLVATLTACSLLPKVPENLQNTVQAQQAVELKNVPFFAQEQFFCGPSALGMVLNYQGESTDPAKLAELVYLPGRKGSLQVEMLAAPRKLAYLSYQIEPRLPALFDALNVGDPVVVLLNLALDIAPQWHYAVVVGYDPNTTNMILRSGAKERELIPLATFLKLWDRSGNWGFTVLKPDQEPPSYANAQNYLNSIVALERSNPAKAVQAYQQGIKTWPSEPWFYFGLGTQEFASKKYMEAEQNYRKAVGIYPKMADAWNNLAETLIQLGRKNEARVAINQAIALGGNRLETYKETAKKIPSD